MLIDSLDLGLRGRLESRGQGNGSSTLRPPTFTLARSLSAPLVGLRQILISALVGLVCDPVYCSRF